MLKQWLQIIDDALTNPNCFHVANKRIIKGMTCTLQYSDLMDPDLTLDMLGFVKKKQTMLTDYYYHQESVSIALSQLEYRRQKKTYGSCGVTTYSHFAKKERPQHGPCIQSLVFTHMTNGKVDVDVFYRTTELFKKFGADLIWLREVMLPQFAPNGTVTFHFANTTYHPMYWAVAVPYLSNPTQSLKKIKTLDTVIWKGILRWTHRFINQPESLQNFKQGYRVSKHLHRLTDPVKLNELRLYIDKHYTPTVRKIKDDEDGEL